MTIIGMKELRTNMEAITNRVKAGESFTVVNRSKPVFNIVPAKDAATEIHDGTEPVRAWTQDFVELHRPAFEALADQ